MQVIQRMEALPTKHAMVIIATTLAIVFCLEDARITETRETFFRRSSPRYREAKRICGMCSDPDTKEKTGTKTLGPQFPNICSDSITPAYENMLCLHQSKPGLLAGSEIKVLKPIGRVWLISQKLYQRVPQEVPQEAPQTQFKLLLIYTWYFARICNENQSLTSNNCQIRKR